MYNKFVDWHKSFMQSSKFILLLISKILVHTHCAKINRNFISNLNIKNFDGQMNKFELIFRNNPIRYYKLDYKLG